MFTMISRIEYRVKAYMFYPNFLWRSFQFSCSLIYSEKMGKARTFFIFLPSSLSKWQGLLFGNKENSHALAFVV